MDEDEVLIRYYFFAEIGEFAPELGLPNLSPPRIPLDDYLEDAGQIPAPTNVSPTGPENRRPPRPRNRSRSPVAIDRYQPDPRNSRDDYFRERRDDRRRAPSPNGPANIDRYVPGQETSNNSVMERLVQDPFKLEYQVGFSYFGEWWRQEKNIKEDRERQRSGSRRPPQRIKGEAEVREEREKEKSQIQVAYDAYKETLQVKMARSFVQAHKGDEWFKERYIPEVRDGIRQQLAKVRVSNYSQWEKDFDAGLFDDFTLEGIYKSESNGVGGVLEKEDGETTAAAEVLGVGDLVPLKGGDPPDETAQQPTLLIKTIAPSVSRAKLEEFCIENLGDTDGGFKSLSLSDPNPSKRYHRIGWVMLKPELNTGIATERGDGRDEEKEAMDDGASTSNGVEEKVQTTTEKALQAINAKTIVDVVRGDFTVHVGVHNPSSLTRKKALWDLFSSPERIDKDLTLAMRVVAKLEEEINAGFEGLAKIEEKVDGMVSNGLLQPPTSEVSGTDKPKKSRYELDMDVDGGDVEEGEEDEMDEDEGAIDEEEKDDEEMLIKKKKLDLIVEYLRRVFNFCFFCVFESDSVHELMRKCPGGHLRRPRASLSTSAKRAAVASALGEPFPMKKDSMEDQDADAGSPTQKFSKFASKNTQQLQRAFNWVKTYEEKLMQLLEPENVDLKKIGGKPVDEALEEELEKFVKQEDENKFRCKVPECTKLFKGVGFWRKHVEKRHPEWFGSLKQDVSISSLFLLRVTNITSLSLLILMSLIHHILRLLAQMPTAMATSLPPTMHTPLELRVASACRTCPSISVQCSRVWVVLVLSRHSLALTLSRLLDSGAIATSTAVTAKIRALYDEGVLTPGMHVLGHMIEGREMDEIIVGAMALAALALLVITEAARLVVDDGVTVLVVRLLVLEKLSKGGA